MIHVLEHHNWADGKHVEIMIFDDKKKEVKIRVFEVKGHGYG